MKREKIQFSLREQLAVCHMLIGSMQETIRTLTYEKQFWKGDMDRLLKELTELKAKP